MVPFKNLAELRWDPGCFHEKDWKKGVLKIFLEAFDEELGGEYGMEFGQSVTLPVGTKR